MIGVEEFRRNGFIGVEGGERSEAEEGVLSLRIGSVGWRVAKGGGEERVQGHEFKGTGRTRLFNVQHLAIKPYLSRANQRIQDSFVMYVASISRGRSPLTSKRPTEFILKIIILERKSANLGKRFKRYRCHLTK